MKLPFIKAGEVVTTHGVRGEVKVLPWTDGQEFLCGMDRVRIGGQDYAVDGCRIQKGCNLLKLRGVDTVEAGQALRGKTVEVYREDAPEDLIFADELIGVAVYAGETCLGTVTEVLDYPGNKVYVVQGDGEYLIPAVRQFVHRIDLDANRMEVTVIEGMRSDED